MDRELYWKAVTENDARFDGAFVLGVKTTGIYCRPSCRARQPKRANVDFYETAAAAEGSGFRACKRCRPENAAAVEPTVAKIIEACRALESDASLSLESLATRLGLSAAYLQRSFKELIGVSPKKYAGAKKMDRFKEDLKQSGDVAGAMYDAGFNSSSRLYEKAGEQLGMTPAAYKKGGKGMRINYMVADCELGKLLVARTQRGICSVTLGDDAAGLADGLRQEFPAAEISDDDSDLASAVEAIVDYLAGKTRRLLLPLDIQATAFQLQVWEFLRQIPYGETRSYSEVAEALGDRKKVRAVARACATNRIALAIPCHRVVASDGKLSGYRWGIERKERLLEAEKRK